MKYGNWTLGQTEALLNRLGESNARKLLDYPKVEVAFPENAKPKATIQALSFQVWQTIKIGVLVKSAFGQVVAQAHSNRQVSQRVLDMLNNKTFTVATSEEEVELVHLFVSELGFVDGAKYGDIWDRAIEMGLQLCPAEVGPLLLIQNRNLRAIRCRIAMRPIQSTDGHLEIFAVERDGDNHHLTCYLGESDRFYGANEEFIFRLPANSL